MFYKAAAKLNGHAFPVAIRSLAKTALNGRNKRLGRDAIQTLHKQGVLPSPAPMHHELVRITQMTDEEVSAILRRGAAPAALTG